MELAECFPVFPSPSGCNNHGNKGEFVRTLERIATRMNSARPNTLFKWDPDSELPAEMVIKRDYSDGCRHVFLPTFLRKEPPVQDIEKDRKRFKRWIGNSPKNSETGRAEWIAQEFVHTLNDVGEMRFLCANGKIVRTVTTQKASHSQPTFQFTEEIPAMISLRDMQ